VTTYPLPCRSCSQAVVVYPDEHGCACCSAVRRDPSSVELLAELADALEIRPSRLTVAVLEHSELLRVVALEPDWSLVSEQWATPFGIAKLVHRTTHGRG